MCYHCAPQIATRIVKIGNVIIFFFFFFFFFYFFLLHTCSCIKIKFTMVVFKQHLNNNRQYKKVIFTELDYLIYRKLYYSIRSIDPNV